MFPHQLWKQLLMSSLNLTQMVWYLFITTRLSGTFCTESMFSTTEQGSLPYEHFLSPPPPHAEFDCKMQPFCVRLLKKDLSSRKQ